MSINTVSSAFRRTYSSPQGIPAGAVNPRSVGPVPSVNPVMGDLAARDRRELDGQQQALISAVQKLFTPKGSASAEGLLRASSSDAASVKVSTGINAAAGSYAINVQRLAASQTVSGAPLPSTCSARWQATWWPGPSARKAGAVSAQPVWRQPQRGAMAVLGVGGDGALERRRGLLRRRVQRKDLAGRRPARKQARRHGPARPQRGVHQD